MYDNEQIKDLKIIEAGWQKKGAELFHSVYIPLHAKMAETLDFSRIFRHIHILFI